MDKEVLWIDLAKIPEGVSLEKLNEDFDKLGVWSQQAVDSLLESYNTKEIKMEKYYTPELSELHIGFEVEKAVYISTEPYYPSPSVLDSWEKVTINHPIMMSICSWGASEFRVKYLDQQDIEECGFTYIGNSTIIKEGLFEIDGWTSYCIRLYHREHDHRLIIVARDLSVLNEEIVLFQGIIKNKTEFKKLLKMLWV